MSKRIWSRWEALTTKPRLLATFTALTMLVACAVPSVLPHNAGAAEIGDTGAICTPDDIELGDDTTKAGVDKGIATWVGRDMYVGYPPADTTTINAENKPEGSFAAEAEGLTAIAGKLVLNPYKESWSNNGFRFGTVGFGAQYRPAVGQYALAVAGTNSAITTLTSGGVTGDVGAFARGAFVGNAVGDNAWYQANLAGDMTKIQDNTNRASVIGFYDGTGTDSDTVHWNATNPLNVNGKNYADYDGQGHDYTYTVQQQSQWMTQMHPNGTVTTGDAPNNDAYWRHKYNNGDINYKFVFDESHKEKLITFTGDGESLMQIFNVNASDLSSVGYSGISYKFEDIPDSASVVINVTGGNVDFHNGWRFWWNGNEIGNGYTTFTPSGMSAAEHEKDAADYGTASQAIMWNFADASNVTIRGGAYNGQTDNGTDLPIGTGANELGDDPAAAMLGSIIVPNGTFVDHVTTNGRVWVGQDFMMYNPTWVVDKGGSFTDGASASIIDMDQERHNFPWSGSVQDTCSIIAWDKVSSDGSTLGGTSFSVYATLADAVAGDTNKALYPSVTDNIISTSDYNLNSGSFEVQKLNPNSNYYIRELATNNNSYQLNTNIYQIQAGDGGDTRYSDFYKVYDSQGNEITSESDKLLFDGKIINEPSGATVAWGKYADGDTTYTGLAGSEWTLVKDGQEYTITDNTAMPTAVTIWEGKTDQTGQSFEVEMGQQKTFTASIAPSDAVQDVVWESDHPEYVVVQDGKITVIDAPTDGNISVTITATSVSNPEIKGTVTIVPKPVEVTSLTVKLHGSEVTTASVELGKTLTLVAETEPAFVRVLWESVDESVATVNVDGQVTGVKAGTTEIRAYAGDKEYFVTVTVTDMNSTTIYFDNSVWGMSDIQFGWNNPSTSEWEVVDMTPACDGYVMATVPSGRLAFDGLPFSGTHYYHPSGDQSGNFKIPAGTQYYTISSSAVGSVSQVAPCVANTRTTSQAKVNAQAAPITTVDSDLLTFQNGDYSIQLMSDDTNDVEAAADTTEADTNNPYYDVDPKTGMFKLANLPTGTYTLKEKTAPNGYLLNTTEYQFKVENGEVTWISGNPTVVDGVAWISDKPTEFAWDKVDAGYEGNEFDTKNPLAGSSWTLQQFDKATGNYVTLTGYEAIADCDADGCTGKDIDPTAGSFKLTQLNVGKYRLVEQAAPEGYITDTDTYYYFEISDSSTTVPQWIAGSGDSYSDDGSYNGSERAASTNLALNYRDTGSITWQKISSEKNPNGSNIVLEGSEWRLTYVDADKKDGSPADIICAISDSATTCTQNGASVTPNWATNNASSNGEFSYKGLPWGTYTIVETQAPDGYYLDSTEHTYVVGPESKGGSFTINVGGIENTPGVILPETGGEGNAKIILFGFALVAISLLGCGLAIKTRKA